MCRWRTAVSVILLCGLLSAEGLAQQAFRVAVLPFNAPATDAELAPLGPALADMLATDLAHAQELQLVERVRLKALKEEIALGASGAVNKKTAARAGRLLGADILVVGRLTSLRPQLRIDARAVSAETGEVLAAAKASGDVKAFFEVEASLATKLLAVIGVKLSPIARMKVRRAATRSLDAAVHYGRALSARRRGDKNAARRALSAAISADPSFAAAKAQLAALTKRVDALEQRTKVIEGAGGRILRPVAVTDHLHNAELALERGNHPLTRKDLVALLTQRPAAVAAYELWAQLPSSADAKLPKSWASLVSMARALQSGGKEALAQGGKLQLRKLPAEPLKLAQAWFRLRILSKVTGLSAELRAEWAVLSVLLARLGSDRRLFVREKDARAAIALLKRAAAQRAASVGPTHTPELPAGIFPALTRGQLLARPIAVTTPERRGRGLPRITLNVRVADAGSREVKVYWPGEKEPLSLAPSRAQRFGAEASVFVGGIGRKTKLPKTLWMRVTVERVDPLGQVVRTQLKLPTPQVWSGSWRQQGRLFGYAVVSKYPEYMFKVGRLSGDKSPSRLLIDPDAGVWGAAKFYSWGFPWQAMIARRPGPLFRGRALQQVGAKGERAVGQVIPLAMVDGQRPLALGSVRVMRMYPQGVARSYWVTAARAGWMSGALTGVAAPLDHDVVVDALMRAKRPKLALQALADATAGVSDEHLLLWSEAPAAARAATSLCTLKTKGRMPALLRALKNLGRAPCKAPTSAPTNVTKAGLIDVGAGVRLDAAPVSVDAYGVCAKAGACTPLLDDRCLEQRLGYRRTPFGGNQPAHCLPVTPNPYPVTWIKRADAQRYCAARGGRLPSASEWRKAAAKGASKPKNLEDFVTCNSRRVFRSDPLPAACSPWTPSRMRDPFVWWAPTSLVGYPGSNVKEWVQGGKGAFGVAIGCSAYQPPGASCGQKVGLKTLAAYDVGFRCAYDRGDSPRSPKRGKRPSASAFRWLKVPTGGVHYGAVKRVQLDLSADSSDARAALLADVPGLKRSELDSFVDWLLKLGCNGVLPAHLLEEQLAKGLWQGKSRAVVLGELRGEIQKQFESEESRRSRQSPKPGQVTAATEALAWVVKSHTRWRANRLKKRKGALAWRHDRSLLCDDREDGQCSDPTGTRTNRLTHEPRRALEVKVDGFEMLKTEVTGAQFAKVMGWDPSLRPCANCPVERVTQVEARAFCAKVGGRLPTEAEWVRAARGDNLALRSRPLDELARWWGNSSRVPGAVATKKSGPYGHKDLIGGLWEWTADRYQSSSRLELREPALRFRSAEALDVKGAAGKTCLIGTSWLRSLEQRFDELPWRKHARYKKQVACFDTKDKGFAALMTRMTNNPRGPVADESKDTGRVIVGGSFASDVRFVHGLARVEFEQHLRSPFVGFRCVR